MSVKCVRSVAYPFVSHSVDWPGSCSGENIGYIIPIPVVTMFLAQFVLTGNYNGMSLAHFCPFAHLCLAPVFVAYVLLVLVDIAWLTMCGCRVPTDGKCQLAQVPQDVR